MYNVKWLYLLFLLSFLLSAQQNNHPRNKSKHSKKHAQTSPKREVLKNSASALTEESVLIPLRRLEIEDLPILASSPSTEARNTGIKRNHIFLWAAFCIAALLMGRIGFGKPAIPNSRTFSSFIPFHFSALHVPSLKFSFTKPIKQWQQRKREKKQELEAISDSLSSCATTFFESFMDRNNGSCHAARFNHAIKTFPKRKQVIVEVSLNTQNEGANSWGKLKYHLSGEVDEILNHCFPHKSVEDCTLYSLGWENVTGKPEKAVIRLRLKEG